MPGLNEDTMDIEILADGTIKVTTPKISAGNHMGADQLLTFLGRLAGGETTVKRNSKHVHTHSHEHEANKA